MSQVLFQNVLCVNCALLGKKRLFAQVENILKAPLHVYKTDHNILSYVFVHTMRLRHLKKIIY